MFTQRFVGALLVVAGLAVPAVAQDAVSLKWKFEKGKPFYQTMDTNTNQTIKVMGSDIPQKQGQIFYYSWVLDSESGGDFIFKQKIEGVKMDINIGGSRIDFDSTKEGSPTNSLAEFFKALIGFEFKIKVGPDYKVKDIEGKPEFIKKLSQANPTMDTLLKQILSDDAMKEMADPTFAAVPGKDVKKGDKWERESKLDMGPIGTYKTKYTYTYEGLVDEKDKNKHKIKVESELTYTKPSDAMSGGGLPFKIKDANIPPAKGTGTIVFDTDKGWVESSEMKLSLKGDLTIEIGGQTTKVELSQDQTTKVTTSKDNPVPAKKAS